MALTRKMLKAMGIEDEKIDEIIEAHTEVTDGLKRERDAYKEEADKLPEIQSQYDDLKKKVEDSDNDDESYKEKYENEHQAFEDYKASIETEKVQTKKVEAYKNLLKDAGVSEKRIDAIIKVTSMDDVELDDSGNIKDADSLKETVKEEWSEFITTEEEKGASTSTPPSNEGGASDKQLSRAAMVAQKHNERMYGVKGEK